jgi:hypothetical protein
VTKSNFDLIIPSDVIKKCHLKDGIYNLNEQLYNSKNATLKVENGLGTVNIEINPLDSFVFEVK